MWMLTFLNTGVEGDNIDGNIHITVSVMYKHTLADAGVNIHINRCEHSQQ